MFEEKHWVYQYSLFWFILIFLFKRVKFVRKNPNNQYMVSSLGFVVRKVYYIFFSRAFKSKTRKRWDHYINTLISNQLLNELTFFSLRTRSWHFHIPSQFIDGNKISNPDLNIVKKYSNLHHHIFFIDVKN